MRAGRSDPGCPDPGVSRSGSGRSGFGPGCSGCVSRISALGDPGCLRTRIAIVCNVGIRRDTKGPRPKVFSLSTCAFAHLVAVAEA